MALLPVDGGPRQQPASTYAGNAFEPSGYMFRTVHDRKAHALREADRIPGMRSRMNVGHIRSRENAVDAFRGKRPRNRGPGRC
jgi:hypothetical protein